MACVRNMCMYYRFFVNSSFDLLYLEGFWGIGHYCASLHVHAQRAWNSDQSNNMIVFLYNKVVHDLKIALILSALKL